VAAGSDLPDIWVPLLAAFHAAVCRDLEAARTIPGLVLALDRIDLDEIATALVDQTDYEHRWLFTPQTGEVSFWTSDTGIDGQNPVDLDELDPVCIDPLPPYVWCQDMADFAELSTSSADQRRTRRAATGACHRW
jgi:hypothetical protein